MFRFLPWVRNGSFLALTLVSVALLSAGCSMSGAGGGGGSPDLITEEAIQEVADREHDAYQVVNRIRPRWLRTRGVSSLGDPNPVTPVVYLDGVRFGDVDSLRRLNSNGISEIRYMGALDAQTRFGQDHTGGAILVTSRR